MELEMRELHNLAFLGIGKWRAIPGFASSRLPRQTRRKLSYNSTKQRSLNTVLYSYSTVFTFRRSALMLRLFHRRVQCSAKKRDIIVPCRGENDTEIMASKSENLARFCVYCTVLYCVSCCSFFLSSSYRQGPGQSPAHRILACACAFAVTSKHLASVPRRIST